MKLSLGSKSKGSAPAPGAAFRALAENSAVSVIVIVSIVSVVSIVSIVSIVAIVAIVAIVGAFGAFGAFAVVAAVAGKFRGAMKQSYGDGADEIIGRRMRKGETATRVRAAPAKIRAVSCAWPPGADGALQQQALALLR